MADNGPLIAVATPMISSAEDCSLTAYWDPIGHCWTIAWGRADSGVTEGMTCTQAEADQWRDQKIIQIIAQIDDAKPWWREMVIPRQAVWVDMAYEMGTHGLMGFPLMIAADQVGNWGEAEAEMQASLWAHQVPSRAKRDWTQMLTGIVQQET